MLSQNHCLGGGRWDIGWRKSRRDAAIGNTRRAYQATQKGLVESTGKGKLALEGNNSQDILGMLQDDHRILR